MTAGIRARIEGAKAHIFDLDGTLLDSMGMWINIDTAVCKERKIAFPNKEKYDVYVKNVIPLNPLESAAYAKEFFNLKEDAQEILEEWNARAIEEYRNKIPLKLGSFEYLTKLYKNGAKLGIATGSPQNLCTAALKRHNIYDMFGVICTSDEVGVGKQDPAIFLLVAEKLGAKPNDCIVYEDSVIAIKTAKNAGMTVCAVYDEASKEEWTEIQKIADFAILGFETL
ncbi:MAG: HAD family phosphatase [Turicibacter sp.]|nr:HAD family phosphatase [Turicibacter sp.]